MGAGAIAARAICGISTETSDFDRANTLALRRRRGGSRATKFRNLVDAKK
jgi:hypothetical protein